MLEPRPAGARAQERRDTGDVVERAHVQPSRARAVAALVEGDGGQSGGAHGPGVVVMALFAGPGAVQDHHAARNRLRAVGQPQRVGEAVEESGLGRTGSGSRHRAIMPGRAGA
jgi:hypothetical protein